MKNTRGFSLIEVLIVIVLLGFVMAAAVGFGNNIRVSNESRTLTGEMADRQSVFTSRIKTDFDAVGYNLKGTFQTNGSGQVTPLFFSSRDYEVSPQRNSANITRQSDSGETDLLSAWGLIRGNSEISFAPNSVQTTVGYRDSNNDRYTFDYTDLQEWEINVAGRVFPDDDFQETMSPGDRVTIALDSSEADGCAMSFYFLRGEERRFLLRRPINCQYQFQGLINLEAGGTIKDFTLRGSWFNRLDLDSDTAQMPAFPTKNGVSSSVPVWIEERGSAFTLLKSDLTADALRTLAVTAVNDERADVELTTSNSLRGEFEKNDFCLFIDDSAHKSVLGKVATITPNTNETVITFTPVSRENPAWESFYSDPSDFLNHSFPVGSRLVRLSAPVTYRLAANGDAGDPQSSDRVILRREGLAPWEKVAFGVTESLLRHDTAYGQNNFVLDFSILPENATSVDPRPVSIIFSPSGLNAR